MSRREEDYGRNHVPGDSPFIYAITLGRHGLSEYIPQASVARILARPVDPIDYGKELIRETLQTGMRQGKIADEERIVALAVCDHLRSAAAILPKRRPNYKYPMLRTLAGMSWVVQPDGAEPKMLHSVTGNKTWLEEATPEDTKAIGGDGLSMGLGGSVRVAMLPSFYMGKPASHGVTWAVRAQEDADYGYNIGLVPRPNGGFYQHLIPAGELALHGSGITY